MKILVVVWVFLFAASCWGQYRPNDLDTNNNYNARNIVTNIAAGEAMKSTNSLATIIANQISSSNLVNSTQVGTQVASSNYVTSVQVGAQIGSSNLVTSAQVATQIAASNLVSTTDTRTLTFSGSGNTMTGTFTYTTNTAPTLAVGSGAGSGATVSFTPNSHPGARLFMVRYVSGSSGTTTQSPIFWFTNASSLPVGFYVRATSVHSTSFGLYNTWEAQIHWDSSTTNVAFSSINVGTTAATASTTNDILVEILVPN